jgi:deoxyribonuclease-4
MILEGAMGRIGAHMSIAGGLPRAVERAVLHGCESLQIFSKSANQWRPRPLPADEIAEFRRSLAASRIFPAFAHAGYLMNLAAREPVLRARSLASFGEELDRAEALGLEGVVIHPGACTGRSEEEGIERIADALRRLLGERRRSKTKVILEQTAGQGTSIGHSFEQLAQIIRRTGSRRRVAVCLDTCHMFAAGYDIASAEGYERTFRAFDEIVGLDRLLMFHLNDSKRGLGSRVDRHAHIGKGEIGLPAFARLVNDRRFDALPMLLETPKTDGRGRRFQTDPLDVMNLRTLRRLRRPPPAAASASTRLPACL